MQLQRGNFEVLDFINLLICHWNNMVNNVSFWWSTNWCFCKLSFGVYCDFFLLGNRRGRRKWAIDSQPLLLWALIQQLAIMLIGIYLYKMSFWQSWQKLDPPPPSTLLWKNATILKHPFFFFLLFYFPPVWKRLQAFKFFFFFLWIKNNKKRCLGQLTTQSFFLDKIYILSWNWKNSIFFSVLTEHFFN